MQFPTLLAIVISLISFLFLTRQTGLFKRNAHWLPRVIDATMAGINITIGIWLVAYLDKVLPFKIFAGPMTGSCIAFMGNPKPPTPTVFLCCNCICFLVGITLHELQYHEVLELDTDQLRALSTGTSIVFWRLSKMSFSAALAIGTIIGEKGWGAHSTEPFRFLLTPWFAGHTFLYVLAWILSAVRSRVRQYVTGRELRNKLMDLARREGKSVKQSYEETMKTLFDQVDTSNDARVDATEMKVAIRKLTGNDTSLEDCERMVGLIDTDGNGTLNFNEFCQALEQHHQINVD